MKKVMLVEDEDFILQGIKNIIDWEALGMTIVHMAQDGLEALACWEKEEVDIVVSDISMPRMGGPCFNGAAEREKQKGPVHNSYGI